MSVLDTLVVMFEAKGADKVAKDTKGVKDGIDGVEKSGKKGEKQNKDLSQSFGQIASAVSKATVPLIAFKVAIANAFEYSKAGNDLRLMSQFAGESVQNIQQLGNALKSYGGNAASASAVMGDLNSSLQQMRMGQGGKLQEAALLYGLDMTGSGEQGLATADEMMMNIAKRMEGLNTQQQLDFGKMLGLDAPTIMMLQGGVKGLTADMERAKGMAVYDQMNIQNAKRFNDVLISLRTSFEKVKAIISNMLLPDIERFMKLISKVNTFLAEHKAVAILVFTAVGTALVAMALSGAAALWTMIAPLLIAAAPFIAIGAAIGLVGAALYLVYDDFMVFLAGGESVCGAVVDGFKWVWEQIKVFGTFIKDFWSGVWQSIIDKFHSIFGGMMDKFKAIRKLLGLGKETVDAGATAMEDTKTPLSTMTSNSISNSATSQNANNVSVQGITINTAATDADGISKDIGGSLEKQMQRVLYQNYSGAVA